MASIRTRYPASTLVEVLVSMTIISTVILVTFMIMSSVTGSHLITIRLIVSDEISRVFNEETFNVKSQTEKIEYESFYLETTTECYNDDCSIMVVIVRAYSDNGRLIQEARQLMDSNYEKPTIGEEN
ncbi:MAG: hypothetical protein RBS37_00225 [Bacteroidales bacterium]|jgi:hypothetical protein|nr:hypothetical protein [Bacteroidales bacterium]